MEASINVFNWIPKVNQFFRVLPSDNKRYDNHLTGKVVKCIEIKHNGAQFLLTVELDGLKWIIPEGLVGPIC